MKKIRTILLGIGIIAALLYGLARMATPPAEPTAAEHDTSPKPPAEYPADFEQKLRSVPHIHIRLHREEELPADIVWVQPGDFPEIGSDKAKKGGTLRLCNVGPYPANFLAFGSPSPQFFHYNLFDCIEVPLVRTHPDTGEEIPGLAEQWAEHDGKLWFRLNSKARYSNGRPVRARDFALYLCMQHELGNVAPSHRISSLEVYGDSVLAVRTSQCAVIPFATAAAHLHPAEPGFYKEFGSDYRTRYAHRIPPTTGAYTVGRIQRGRMLSLERNKNWWAAELRGFRYTCNIDTIEHHFLTDEAQAWEFFLRGKLDIMQTRNIVAWQDYLRQADANIAQHRIDLMYPMPPYGIALNAAALPDIQLRQGVMHAMDMQHAMNIIFRGDAERLPQFSTGYHHLPHRTPHYTYSPEKARAAFTAAGYTESGPDGILRKKDGTKLSIRLAFSPSQKISTLVNLLSQSAAACGLEIIPEPLPWQHCAKLIKEEKHEMLFWATVATSPIPDYRRHFHSEAKGDDAPFCLRNEMMDTAIATVESAANAAEAKQACAEVDLLIHSLAIWLPGWMENKANVAAWPHVHFPRTGYRTYDVADSHVLWISSEK